MRFLVLSFSYLFFCLGVSSTNAIAQQVIPIAEKGGLHAAYIVPNDRFHRVDVQLIVLSVAYDDPGISGLAHLTEHLAAFSADRMILRRTRQRDLTATVNNVSTVFTNSGAPENLELLMQLSRAVLDTPDLPADFAESEIDILTRETYLRERNAPYRWIKRLALQTLYGSKHGRANSNVEDLPRLTVEDAFEFHQQHYVPSNVTLIISGMVDVDQAKALVQTYFGETERSKPPAKPWLTQTPEPGLNAVTRVSSDRISHDTVLLVQHVDLPGHDTSIDLQGEFFLATAINGNRLSRALHYEDTRLYGMDTSWYFSKVADLEFTISAHPMPGVSLEAAQGFIQETLSELLDDPITPEEIEAARQQSLIRANAAAQVPRSFLWYLKNVAADGYPPVTPESFAVLIENTDDASVAEFAENSLKPIATSVVLATKER